MGCNLNTCHGILAIIGGIIIHFTFGHFYTISNMVPYIMSYIRSHGQPNTKDSLSIWFSAAALGMQGVAMPLGGLAARKIGVRPVVIISCIINSGSILLTYLTVQHTFVTLILTYAFLVGFGFGFAYSVVMAAAVSWFPHRRGLVVGMIVAGFGLGALICTPIQTAFINPKNLKVNSETKDFSDPDLLSRVPTAFLLMGGILMGLQIIGIILLRPKPVPKKIVDGNTGDANQEELILNGPQSSANVKTSAIVDKKDNVKITINAKGDFENGGTAADTENPIEIDLSPKQMVRCLDFYILWFIMLCHIIPITIITSAYKLFGQKYIDDDFYLSMIVTISSVFNSGGRVIWGFIVDKLSFKIPLLCMLTFWATVLFTFPHLSYLSGAALKALFAIWVFFMFFSLSGVFALMPAATGNIFGPTNLATNYGIVFTAFAAGSLLCAIISTFVTSTDAYVAQFSGCGAVCLLALFATLWLEDRQISPKLNCFQWFASRCMRYRRPRPTLNDCLPSH